MNSAKEGLRKPQLRGKAIEQRGMPISRKPEFGQSLSYLVVRGGGRAREIGGRSLNRAESFREVAHPIRGMKSPLGGMVGDPSEWFLGVKRKRTEGMHYSTYS